MLFSMSAYATNVPYEESATYSYSLNESFSGEFGYKSNTYKSLLIGGSISQYLNYRDSYRSTSGYSYSIANDTISGPYFEAVGNNTSMSWSGMFMEAPEVPATEYQVVEANIKLGADSKGSLSSVFLQVTDKEQEKKNANSGTAKKIAILGIYENYIKIATSSTANLIITYSTFGIDTFKADEWHNIKLILDTTRSVYDLIIDDIIFATDLPTSRTVTAPSIGRVFFNPFSSNTGSKAGIDDVKIYGVTATQANTIVANAYYRTINKTYTLKKNGYQANITIPILGNAVNSSTTSKIAIDGTIEFSTTNSTSNNNAFSQISIPDATSIAKNDKVTISISRPVRETSSNETSTISLPLYDKKLSLQEFALEENFSGTFTTDANNLVTGGSLVSYQSRAKNFGTFSIASDAIHADYLLSTLTASISNLDRGARIMVETPLSYDYQVVELDTKLETEGSSAFLQLVVDKDGSDDFDNAAKLGIIEIHSDFMKMHYGNASDTNDTRTENIYYSDYNLPNIKPNDWKKIRVVFDKKNALYDVYFEDILIATDIESLKNLTEYEYNGIKYICFNSLGNAGAKTAVDDIKVYGITPELANMYAKNSFDNLFNDFDIKNQQSIILPYCGSFGTRNTADKAKIAYAFSNTSNVSLLQNYYNFETDTSGTKSYLTFKDGLVDTTLTVNISRNYKDKPITTLSINYHFYKVAEENTYKITKLYFTDNNGISTDFPSRSGKIIGADIDFTSNEATDKALIIAVYQGDVLFNAEVLRNFNSGKSHVNLDIPLPDDISGCRIVIFFFEDFESLVPASPQQNYELSPTSLFEILGNDKVTYNASSEELEYTVSNTSYDIKWSVQGDGVEIDSETGKLLLNANVSKNTNIVIKAALAENPFIYATKTVAVVTSTTYQNDVLRMNVTKDYVDKVLSTSDTSYPSTPLLPNGFNVTTGDAAKWKFQVDDEHPNSEIAFSDLASQGNFMRSLEAISKLTNDSTYHDRMLDIYSKYITDYKAVNGLLKMGGHAVIDLNTNEYVGAQGNEDTHELKDQLMYYTPLFESDSDEAASYLRQIWLRHIKDFSNLGFNRHASFTGSFRPLNNWNNIDQYDESDLDMICDRDTVTFRTSANDYIHAAVNLYQNTGDEKGLIWAKRLLDRYNALKNSTTNIGVYQISTSHNASNLLQLPENWWTLDNYSDYTATYYGDRAYNQFADDLISDGIFPESKRGYILEANLVDPVSLYVQAPMVEMELAKAFGYNSDEGKEIMTSLIKSMAGFIEHAYIPSRNRFNRIWNDGTVMSDYVIKKNGYYGKAGRTLGYDKVTSDYLVSYCKAYFESAYIEGLENEREIMWSFIRNAFIDLDIGDVGVYSPGDSMNLTMNNTCNDPYTLLALLEIYNNTSIMEYLDLARKIGDNIVQNNVYNGWFVKNKDTSKYTRLDDMYCYALIKLEATTINKNDVVPEILLGDGYFHSYIIDSTGEYKRSFCYNVLWNENR